MNASLAIAMLLVGSVTGFFGWRRATKYVYRRSLFDENRPPGVSHRDYERRLIRQRKIWRLVSTILYALLGAAVGAALWALLARP
jgi:hypothetical protein